MAPLRGYTAGDAERQAAISLASSASFCAASCPPKSLPRSLYRGRCSRVGGRTVRGFSALVVVNDETAPRCSSLPLSPSATVTNSAAESRAGASSRCSSDPRLFQTRFPNLPPKIRIPLVTAHQPRLPPKPRSEIWDSKILGAEEYFVFWNGANPLLCRCLLPMGGQTGKGRNWTAQMARSWKPTRWMNPPTWERAQAGPREREAEDVGLECCSPRRRRRRP